MKLCDFIDYRVANVYGVYGHLGGGKTLTTVEIMVDFLRRGFTVVSNIELFNYPSTGVYQYVQDIQTVDWWALPCGAPRGSADNFRVGIFIDECAEFFDQYSNNSPVVKNFLSWLRHSSKRGQFVFAIVQQPEFISRSVRNLIHKWIFCLDMAQERMPIIRIRPPFLSDYVMRRLYDKWGNLISRGFCLADKYDIGRYYNTAQSIATQGRDSTQSGKLPTEQRQLPSFFWLLIIYYAYITFLLS